MNPVCPECGHDFRSEGIPDELTPYEENDKLFTLQFCSKDCRDTYKENETDD